MSIEKRIVESVEPLINEIATLHGEIKSLKETRPQDGQKGDTGATGAGIDTKAWEENEVCLAGELRMHYFGQVYKAIKNTAQEPAPESSDWERVGTHGLRFTGAKKENKSYFTGDIYVDDGSSFLVMDDGKAKFLTMRGRPGEKGEKGIQGDTGADGRDGLGFKLIESSDHGIYMEMTDGTTHEIDVSKAIAMGIVEGADSVKQIMAADLVATIFQQKDDNSIQLGQFRGHWNWKTEYTVGDLVNYANVIYVCKKAPKDNISPIGTLLDLGAGAPYWQVFCDFSASVILAGSGGAGGGWPPIVDSPLDMQNFGIFRVAPPRPGTVGDGDAVNQLAMKQAIAAGSLYQGAYKPGFNNPDLWPIVDSGFVPPVAGGRVGPMPKPAGEPAMKTPAADAIVWFNFKGHGLDMFAATLAAPLPIVVTFIDGTQHQFNLPPKAYPDVAALIAELNKNITGSHIVAFNAYVNGADLHIGVETLPTQFATSLQGAPSPWPAPVKGPAATVLNTYNWVVSTRDPNVPEYAPPGLPGITPGTVLNNSDLLQWNANLNKFEILRGGNLTQNFADQRYWQLDAGNMAWSNHPYSSGAIVYSKKANAWFVATQNTTTGSGEPGTSQAGALWRKINSTYGATVFFGKGEYDNTPGHQDAAHNWGLPRTVYPAGQQPLNGDSYYDINTGTEVQFVVLNNNAIYTISGVVGLSGAKVGADLVAADLERWPGTHATNPPQALPAYWKVQVTAAPSYTVGAGVFAGKVLTTGWYLVGFSGDKDADNNGWFIVPDVAGNTANWTINTPHPQSVPDTVTARIVYGFKRTFQITIGASVADDTELQLLGGIPEVDGVTHIEIRRTDANGSTYEFDLLTVVAGSANLSPIAVKNQDSHFKKILCNWETGKHFEVGAIVDANAHGNTYEIDVTSYDYDLALVFAGDGVATMGGITDNFRADQNYPNEDLLRLLKAASGDPAASGVIPGYLPSSNLNNVTLPFGTGRVYRYQGRLVSPATSTSDTIFGFFDSTNTRIKYSEMLNVTGRWIKYTGTTITSGMIGPQTNAYGDNWVNFGGSIPIGTTAFVSIEIDKRDSNITLVKFEATYGDATYYADIKWQLTLPTARVSSIYFQPAALQASIYLSKE